MAAPFSPPTSFPLYGGSTDVGAGVTVKIGRVKMHVEVSSGQIILTVWVNIKDLAGNRRVKVKAQASDYGSASVALLNDIATLT